MNDPFPQTMDMKDVILQAIDRVRYQKQRPNIERITYIIKKSHDIEATKIEDMISEFVKNGTVLKVVSKGVASFRNPNVTKRSNHGRLPVDPCQSDVKSTTNCNNISLSENTVEQLEESAATANMPDHGCQNSDSANYTSCTNISEIISDNSSKNSASNLIKEELKITKQTNFLPVIFNIMHSCMSKGVTILQIQQEILKRYKLTGLISTTTLRGLLTSAVKQAIHSGQIIQRGQLFRLSKKLEAYSTQPIKLLNCESKDIDGYYYADILKKTVTPIKICCFCLGDEKKNKEGHPEDLIACADCGNCGHASCLKFSKDLSTTVMKLRWQCIDCKTCSVCGFFSREDVILFCDTCDRGFHMDCCKPPLTKPPKGVWRCDFCCVPENSQPPFIDRAAYERKRYKCPPALTSTTNTKNSPQKSSSARGPGRPKGSKNKVHPPALERYEFTSRLKNVHQRFNDLYNLKDRESRPPLELIDGLSVFFIPSSKRRMQKTPRAWFKPPSDVSKAANKILHKSRKLQMSKKQRPMKPPVRSRGRPRKLTSSPERNANRVTLKHSAFMKELNSSRGRGRRGLSARGRGRGRGRPKGSLGTLHSSLSLNENDNTFVSSFPKRRGRPPLQRYLVTRPPSLVISDRDMDLFRRARTKVQSSQQFTRLIPDLTDDDSCSGMSEEVQPLSTKCHPPCIEFGKYEITTWHSSPYPQEYSSLPKLFVCEFCLKYMKTSVILQRHKKKCTLLRPPGDEIYRKDEISVYEVDGSVGKIYCQNLCLLAKLFLDHKTLYYDVEPFLFYILTLNDDCGSHIIGYFSKEKHSSKKYNLSCIVTLPQYQRRGYGRFLIDFSYLLSRAADQCGSPEEPLSNLGRKAYISYWKNVIIEYFHTHTASQLSVTGISNDTGMAPCDVVNTLRLLSMLTMENGRLAISVDRNFVEDYMKRKNSRSNDVTIDESCLSWIPLVSTQSLYEEEKEVKSVARSVSCEVRGIEEDKRVIESELSPDKRNSLNSNRRSAFLYQNKKLNEDIIRVRRKFQKNISSSDSSESYNIKVKETITKTISRLSKHRKLERMQQKKLCTLLKSYKRYSSSNVKTYDDDDDDSSDKSKTASESTTVRISKGSGVNSSGNSVDDSSEASTTGQGDNSSDKDGPDDNESSHSPNGYETSPLQYSSLTKSSDSAQTMNKTSDSRQSEIVLPDEEVDNRHGAVLVSADLSSSECEISCEKFNEKIPVNSPLPEINVPEFSSGEALTGESTDTVPRVSCSIALSSHESTNDNEGNSDGRSIDASPRDVYGKTSSAVENLINKDSNVNEIFTQCLQENVEQIEASSITNMRSETNAAQVQHERYSESQPPPQLPGIQTSLHRQMQQPVYQQLTSPGSNTQLNLQAQCASISPDGQMYSNVIRSKKFSPIMSRMTMMHESQPASHAAPSCHPTDLEVAQLGLESPTSISSTEMQGGSLEPAILPNNFLESDNVLCEQPSPHVYTSQHPDMVMGHYYPGNYIPSTGLPFNNYMSMTQGAAVSEYEASANSLMLASGQRLNHAVYNNSCSLAKLQQLTNGLNMEILPCNNLAPPNLTPPHNFTPPPPSLMCNSQLKMKTMSQPSAAYEQRSKRRHMSQTRNRAPVDTLTPGGSMPSPNITIQPSSNSVAHLTVFNSYQHQPAPALFGPGYFHQGFVGQQQFSGVPMMNMPHGPASFQPIMQPATHQVAGQYSAPYGYNVQPFNFNSSVLRR